MRLVNCLAPLALLASSTLGEENPAHPTSSKQGEAARFGQIQKILSETCIRCHNPDQKKGGLDLTRRVHVIRGGKSGPAVVPGNVDESLLIEKVEAGEMPPKNPLAAPQVEAIRTWVASGAPYPVEPVALPRAGPDWWSLQPIKSPRVPAVIGPASGWVRTPIDAFILAKLKEKGLCPAPEADRATLIRRIRFDLLGLPPSPEEVERFVKDPDPQSYARLVDQMLASPHYGERWGRHWLDVVRFGESEGYETNMPRPGAWPYRDYVIHAFNRDTPFPRFVLEQLAGDTLLDSSWLTQAATGFLVGGTHDIVGNQTAQGMRQQRVDDLDDIITAAGTAFLGLTVQCSRCHDHKFDPITQQDYYGLQAVFAGVNHGSRSIPAPISEGCRGRAGCETAISVYAGSFSQPGATHILRRGDPMHPGAEVSPSGIAAVRPPLVMPPNAPERDRRVALARWIGDRANPLPARVMVNRVWHYHFGQGIVTTPSNFGYNGSPPSHPDLLDWLAQRYVEEGWRLKPLHRLILLSATYRQSGRLDARAHSVDKQNRLLWRIPPRRLEAESIRDAILACSGLLDSAMGGPGYNIWEKNTNYVAVYQVRSEMGPDTFRRMVYQFKPRSQQDPIFGAFDCPDAALVAPRRYTSTTALQALNLLNSPFILQQATFFAQRLQREAGAAPASQVDRAFALAFGRSPTSTERAAAVALIGSHGTPAFCRAVYNANEFVYVP
jgi:mono/diheme cytochrome c family protein